MTETNTIPRPSDATTLPDLLLALITAFLTPMFLSVSGGNLSHARLAAMQTVNAYRAQSHADLIAVAQIIAFGLAALASLSLSMAEDLSLPMTLRLRNSAGACHRAAEQIRRTLRPQPLQASQPPFQPDLHEAAVIAEVAATSQRAAEAQPKPVPAPPPTPATQPASQQDQHYQAMWAAAAANVAAEYTADLPNLPPAERRAATMRAAMLNSCANDLLTGPPIPRLRPGDLTGFLDQNKT